MEATDHPDCVYFRTTPWNHGSTLVADEKFTTITRTKTGATATPQSTAVLSYPHLLQITVPTSVIIDDRQVNAFRAFLRFRTGSQAQITQIRFFDGEMQFAHFVEPLRALAFMTRSMRFRNPHPVIYAISLSVEVSFISPRPGEAWVEIVGAGVEYMQATPVPLPPRYPAEDELEES